ncbi:hypothetical protein [Micromonospora coriariae]|nr:hypothetical protein [Micromonospora coriariae]
MDEQVTSFEESFRQYSVYKWKIERESNQRLVKLWSEIGTSNQDDGVKLILTDVAWAVGAFERAHDVLEANAMRVEEFRRNGVPAILAFLSGPYHQSLDYNLAISLWMDLADVFVWYRTIVERLGHLKRPARKGATLVTESEIETQIEKLRRRAVDEFDGARATALANKLLHESRHPGNAHDLSTSVYWKGESGDELDFAENGDARDSIWRLRQETVEQLVRFIQLATRA